jgi:hypothetical protein
MIEMNSGLFYVAAALSAWLKWGINSLVELNENVV